MPFPEPSVANQFLLPHADLLLQNFHRWTGKALVDFSLTPLEQAQQLFESPFVVLSHQAATDPIFTYGNRTALHLFELTWAELTQMPSRLSAEPMHQSERQQFLETVARQGYIDNYSGVRISQGGRRFRIDQAIVWNLLDGEGIYCGQAATFSHWMFLS